MTDDRSSAEHAAAAVVRHGATFWPVRVRTFHPFIGCDVSRVVGYRVACSCGWSSATLASVRDCRAAFDVHAHPPGGR